MSLPCAWSLRPSGFSRQPIAASTARTGVPSGRVVWHRCVQVRASHTEPASSTSTEKPAPPSSKSAEDSIDWTQRSVPSYLQSSVDFDVCDEESQALTMGMAGDLLWNAIRAEAQADAASEPLLSSFLYASILAHDSFELSLAFVLANRLANSTMLPTQLFEIFHGVLRTDPEVRCAALSDIAACRERDPACTSYSQALLYYKGYHALQTQRIAHALWNRNQKVMALALQSRMSEVFAVDIHPAARIGKGVLLDHGTGVVIGETAIVGNNVSILQNVTLGGTGKEIGDRHPKVGDNVLIGACATILGNINIGRSAQIAAGSLVLKPVPPHTLVAGSPAKEIGPIVGNPALSMRHWSRRLMTQEGVRAAVAAPQSPSQLEPTTESEAGVLEAVAAAAVVEAAASAGTEAGEQDVPGGRAVLHAGEHANGSSNGNGNGVVVDDGAEVAPASAAAAAAGAASEVPAATAAVDPVAARRSQHGKESRKKKPAPEYEI